MEQGAHIMVIIDRREVSIPVCDIMWLQSVAHRVEIKLRTQEEVMFTYAKLNELYTRINLENDALREKIRREKLLDAGLRLFSKYGIENVKLQDIADEAGVGIATLYNYYQNKPNLVIAISAYMWKKIWDENVEIVGKEELDARNCMKRQSMIKASERI